MKSKKAFTDFLMKFYATIEPCRRLKNLFSNLSSFYIIDVDTILRESKLDPNKATHRYLINSELERLILSGAKSKRYVGMIYINSFLNCDIIVSIKKSIDNLINSTIDSYVILDDVDTPKLNDYYTLFDEVLFFPAMKKTKLIECVPRVIPKINKIIDDKLNKENIIEGFKKEIEASEEPKTD